jgi:Holliday junction DNA helicase RuvA
VSRLIALPGIGKKTAQRLCVELAEKVGGLSDFTADMVGAHTAGSIGEPNALADAVSALVNLGYPQAMAWQALRVVEKQLPEGSEALRVEDLIRLALRSLAAR